ncbi:MAG: RNA 3'-terminal phosphate cyclase [Candidatus Njordarchaeales archaeon]
MSEVKIIDGSMGEGGGQIFRTAIAYAAVTRCPVKIINIRAKRSNPGLRPQHLSALRALAKITHAEVRGDYVGSTQVFFNPKKIEGGEFVIDPGTAGSITLIIQAILPALIFAEKKSIVTIKGGTDVPWSPPIDAVRYVLLPGLKDMGVEAKLELIRRGHYPRGGGLVKLYVEPITEPLKPKILKEQGIIERIRGISHCVRLPKHVAERQARSATEKLESAGFKNIDIELEWYPPDKDPHLGPGSGIVLWVETSSNALLEYDSLGARGKRAEVVGQEAAEGLIKQIRNCGAVDVHHTDQLVPFMALAKGVSEIYSSEISLHTLTAIQVAQMIIGAKFEVKGSQGSPGLIRAEGIGLEPHWLTF